MDAANFDKPEKISRQFCKFQPDMTNLSQQKNIKIKLYNEESGLSWDKYVYKNNAAIFCHLYGWRKVIEKTFSHRSFYLAAECDGEIKGLLPFFEVRLAFFDSAMVSMPFLDYGGICADSDYIKKLLFLKAADLARERKVDYLEFRQKVKMNDEFINREGKVNLRLDLSTDSAAAWDALEGKLRNQIRKAQKSGLEFIVAGAEGPRLFYTVFSRNMRDLGTPVYPPNLFYNVITAFRDKTEVFLVKYKKRVVGGAIAFYFKESMELPWASSLREYFTFCPNNILYWEAIKKGIQRGCRYFDFGRSTVGSSHYVFKKQWGCREERLYYQFYPVNGRGVPDIDPNSSKYRGAVNAWKRLPVFFANMIGPKISSYIP